MDGIREDGGDKPRSTPRWLRSLGRHLAPKKSVGPKVACDKCRVVGTFEGIDKSYDHDGDTIKFSYIELEECGHRFCFSVIDATVQTKIDKVNRLVEVRNQLHRAGDLSGADRKNREAKKAQRAVQASIRLAWGKYQHLATDLNLVPAPKLLRPEPKKKKVKLPR
jgi:hypothetical protein